MHLGEGGYSCERADMPDLLVHATIGYLFVFRNHTRYVIASIFLLGCIFPDLIRGPLLLMANVQRSMGIQIISPDLIIALQIFHSPVPLLIQAWLFCLFFERDLRWRVFVSFSLGIFLHLLLDAGQRAYQISYLWLFPFSFENPVAGLWWSDEGLWLTVACGLIAAILLVQRYLSTRSR